MFYKRDLEAILKRYTQFPVIALLGPRQSGKTTLAKHFFKQYTYINLDDFELKEMAESDPKGFFRKHENEHGIIIDEFQNVPELLSTIKVIVDEHKRPGYFVLTGSQNFLMNEAITQTLAGRIGILTLMPLSLHELSANNLIHGGPEVTMFRGGYPQLYINTFQPQDVYPSYIRTYLERDVRQLINVVNLSIFQRFVKLCAARVGQMLNVAELATQCGISMPTVHQWLTVLEASYIIFLLRPHWTNFNKRLTKTPKLYFFDTGLVCSLLEIDSEKSLAMHPMYGSLFEGFIIADLFKQCFNQGITAPLYFWRDKNGHLEIDCLIDRNAQLTPIEVKSGETFDRHFFDGLTKWCTLANVPQENSYLIYGGDQSLKSKHGTLVGWRQTGNLIKKVRE